MGRIKVIKYLKAVIMRWIQRLRFAHLCLFLSLEMSYLGITTLVDLAALKITFGMTFLLLIALFILYNNALGNENLKSLYLISGAYLIAILGGGTLFAFLPTIDSEVRYDYDNKNFDIAIEYSS